MKVSEYIRILKNDPQFMDNVTSWRVIPARAAQYGEFPAALDPRVKAVLHQKGIDRPYIHQSRAIQAAMEGRDFVVVTPTASGKTLCYNAPVLDAILKDSSSRALYLFPTKALSADQTAELYSLIEMSGEEIKAFTYDGDTPAAARTAIRQAGHVVVTNPDMLHQGILPHHLKWVKLFENLKYVVIDEIHAYRGVFGSNLANVIRRLKRVCAFYGSNPTFICCSATIQNPKSLAETLTGKEMLLIDENGAPAGERHVVFYNPPVINRQLGIREGAIQHTRNITANLLQNGVRSIVFAQARVAVEVLTRYLKDTVRDPLGNAGIVRGYRGGYLPTQRHEIERELREGRVMTVVSTNALELGIDIGQLDACVLCGYPGTIASAWQMAGRAGRRGDTSLLIMVANSSPTNQYLINHPEFFFGRSPEMAYINPDNMYIMLDHIKCAAYELPFEEGELYADVPDTADYLGYLEDGNILRRVGGKYYWSTEEFPQVGVNLRNAADQNFIIIDITDPKRHRVIGEMDRYAVPMLLHKYAIYMHEGEQYQVEELDFPDKKAYIRKVNVGYYTDANLITSLKVLDDFETKPMGRLECTRGEVEVSSIVTLFKKIRFDTHENIGWGDVKLPELEIQTTACWWTLPDEISDKYDRNDLENALVGLTHLIRAVAPVRLMCAVHDIGLAYHVKDTFTGKPTIYLYDTIAGGIGLSDKMFETGTDLFAEALELVTSCVCQNGCPACIGAESERNTKQTLIDILRNILDN